MPKQNAPHDELMPISHAARFLNLSEQRVRELADSGAIAHTRNSMNHRLFSRAVLTKYMARRG